MTHADITDKTLRAMYAKELLTIRRVCWNLGKSPKQDEWMHGLVVGTDTVFRRMQLFLCTDITIQQYMAIPLLERRNIA